MHGDVLYGFSSVFAANEVLQTCENLNFYKHVKIFSIAKIKRVVKVHMT